MARRATANRIDFNRLCPQLDQAGKINHFPRLLLGTKISMSITQFMPNATIHFYRDDLPEGLVLGPVVAVDTETMGLNPHRDRLCLVQLSGGDGHAHIVQLIPEERGGRGFDCPNLKQLLSDPAVVKLMHFGRFDVAVLRHYLGIAVIGSNAPRSPPS